MSFLTYLGRITLLLLIMGSWYYGAWLIALPLTLGYAVLYPAYELCGIGALLDIQFYTGDFVPYYFVGSVLLVVLCRIGVPRLRPHTLL